MRRLGRLVRWPGGGRALGRVVVGASSPRGLCAGGSGGGGGAGTVVAGSPEEEEEEEAAAAPPPMNAFAALGLSAAVVDRCAAAGWARALPIQAEVIPVALRGRDVLAQAATGSGKTAAYALPVVDRCTEAGREGGPRAIVLVPTRELALQVAEAFRRVSPRTSLTVAALYGGRPRRDERRDLKRQDQAPAVVVATPGRLVDHLESGVVDATRVAAVVLDEADRLIDLGFLGQVQAVTRFIRARVASKPQTLLFSATLPESVRALARTELRHDAYAAHQGHGADDTADDGQGRSESTSRVSQHAAMIHGAGRALWDAKVAAMGAVLSHKVAAAAAAAVAAAAAAADDDPVKGGALSRGMIFCKTRKNADDVAAALEATTALRVAVLHGGLDQRGRLEALLKLRHATVHALVATDLGSRGLDIPEMRWVVHMGLPDKRTTFSHRSGRLGRGETFHTGESISFVGKQEFDTLTTWAPDCKLLSLQETKMATTIGEKTALDAPTFSLLRIHSGRRSPDAICAGDVVGGLTARGLNRDDIGRIEVMDRDAYVAVSPDSAHKLLDEPSFKIKNRKRKLSLVEP